MGNDLLVLVHDQVTPAVNSNMRFPGKRSCPAKSPVRTNVVAVALNLVKIELRVLKPSINQADHAAVAIASSKFVEWIFEVNLIVVNIVVLVFRKLLVVSLNGVEDVVHKNDELR